MVNQLNFYHHLNHDWIYDAIRTRGTFPLNHQIFLRHRRIDPSYLKAYYRRASANYALGKLKEALKDFKQVVKLKPKDEDAMKKMKTCEKEMKAEAFTKAIESEGGPSITSLMSLMEIDAIVVESSYDGPNLSIRKSRGDSSADGSGSSGLELDGGYACGSQITIEFVHEMIARFKSQQLLHRKYEYLLVRCEASSNFLLQIFFVHIFHYYHNRFTVYYFLSNALF